MAHDWDGLYAAVERLVAGHVDGDGEVDERHAGQHDGQLAQAHEPADALVLLGDEAGLVLATPSHRAWAAVSRLSYPRRGRYLEQEWL